MNTPVIDPSTLTEEQREAIRNKYAEVKAFSIVTNGMFSDDTAMFEWLFGSEFFKQKGE